jgi:hypothetical protein
VAFCDQDISELVDMLESRLPTRSCAKAMHDLVPGKLDALTVTFILKVEKKLLNHAWS